MNLNRGTKAVRESRNQTNNLREELNSVVSLVG